MKTLLVGINAKYIHTNLAIRYLYTFTHQDYDVDFKEFTIKDQDQNIIDYIVNEKPDLIGFSCYIWNIEKIVGLLPQLKNKLPHLIVLLGGPEVSYDTEFFLSNGVVDYIISGEGEYSFKDLLHALNTNNQSELEKIPQLHFKKESNIVHNNKEYMIDFSSLPSPYRLDRDLKMLDKRIQYIESSRGCPYQCSYCLASLEKQVRQFDANRVKDEIRFLMQNGARVFKFLDRTFNMRRDYAIDMFQFIIDEHKEHTVFQFEITGDLLDEAIIHFLNTHAPKGLIRFEIGVQSTNEYTNKLILRKQNYQKLAHNIQLIQAGGRIDLHLDLIAGLPKEDYPSFQKTFNDVFSLRPHELQLGFLKMLRGTKIRKEAPLYHYRYHETAPYEIIDHEDISELELNKIHLAEEMLEKYYNSHRFDHTMNYLLDYLYPANAYQFFEDFGIYWTNHYSNINYQLHDLCLRLLEFIKINHPHVLSTIQSLLIYDYLKEQKTKPKIWFNNHLTREERNLVIHTIHNQQLIDSNFDQLHRYGYLTYLTIDPFTYIQGNFTVLKMFEPTDKSIYLFKDLLVAEGSYKS
jgi:anaerobic magnesium-protoporphyrin IX monomethyl ester cyclase